MKFSVKSWVTYKSVTWLDRKVVTLDSRMGNVYCVT